MTCIEMGSDKNHFNVSLIVRDSHKAVSTDHNFWRERRAEAGSKQGPSAYQPNALLLGQTWVPVPHGRLVEDARTHANTLLTLCDVEQEARNTLYWKRKKYRDICCIVSVATIPLGPTIFNVHLWSKCMPVNIRASEV